MSKVMYKKLATALDITATGAKTPVALTATPFLGGQGRSGLLSLQAAVGGSGSIKVQGNDSVEATVPAEADAGWYDIVTLTSASQLEQEIEFPRYIRLNVATAGTGTLSATLHGTQ